MSKFTRRAVLAGAAASAGVVAGRNWLQPRSDPGPGYPSVDSFAHVDGSVLDDASELNPTKIYKHVTLNSGLDTSYTNRLRAFLADAVGNDRPFCASTARHSMGGHALPDQGLALTLSQKWIEADQGNKTYRVTAGTRWSTIIAELDKIGFSPVVMQSNNDFGVGGTFSVNAHGWPAPFGPMGSTVRSFRLMRADGDVIKCSREDNKDLFSLVMGGYGLFGLITDLELDMVPNARLTPHYMHLRGPDLGKVFAETLAGDSAIQMAYGRLDVSLDRFFDDGLLITYRPTEDQSALPAAGSSGFVSHVSAALFRSQLGSDAAKRFRWWTETTLGPITVGETTRNSLMNEPAVTLSDGDATRTDILHEYFVPPDRFHEFVGHCQQVIPSSYQQLMNITVRYVAADKDSVLNYAAGPRIASVMLFSQEKTVRGEADMARMTHHLIERVLSLGGTYYLPYRPHATLEQFRRAYPRAEEFAARKREHDKGLTFRNRFWDNYVSKL
ncbi:MAG: FAD-binding oxidoreductase [Rhizobium sp.]|nr:FAD-binding oxidoreductase [Rhizobium sp.]